MLTVTRVDVWSAVVEDRPGGLKQKLEGLAMAGADLDFVLSRRRHEEPGTAMVFLTPLRSDKEIEAARKLGFKRSEGLHSLRVQGPDEPGIVYRLSCAMAQEGINLRGLSAARLGKEFVLFLALDTPEDAEKALRRLTMPV